LQSANEEVVSSNEELQTVNEELETSKEEIESTNEELTTTNQELQTRTTCSMNRMNIQMPLFPPCTTPCLFWEKTFV
jgi:two-component system, chemotaxis family, CheB/CheR fusion protein